MIDHKFKIEKVSLRPRRRQSAKVYSLLSALQKLKPGESFMADIRSTDRLVLSIAGFLLDRKFTTNQTRNKRTSKIKFRVGRIK